MYQTVLFDMDGTILDTLADITDSVNFMLRKTGYPLRSKCEVRSHLGNGSAVLVEKALGGEANKETVQKAVAMYRAWYKDHADIKTAPYEGIAELMQKLREQGIRIAVASNKPEATVKLLCEKHFSGLVDACVGDVDFRRRKPYPDMIDALLQELGASKDGAVYIGDTEVDVETAKNSNLPCICVGWGFRSRAEQMKVGASVFADSTEELFEKITKCEK